jgi:hypothetical protein
MDHNGLPMHGLLAADAGWVVEPETAGRDGAAMSATLDFAAREDLIRRVPAPARTATGT